MSDFEGFETFFGSEFNLEPECGSSTDTCGSPTYEDFDVCVPVDDAYNPFEYQVSWKPSRPGSAGLSAFVEGARSSERSCGFKPGAYTPVFDPTVPAYAEDVHVPQSTETFVLGGLDPVCQTQDVTRLVPDVPAVVSNVLDISEEIDEPPFPGAVFSSLAMTARVSGDESSSLSPFGTIDVPALCCGYAHLFGPIREGSVCFHGGQSLYYATLRLLRDVLFSNGTWNAIKRALAIWYLPVTEYDVRLSWILSTRLESYLARNGCSIPCEELANRSLYGSSYSGNALFDNLPSHCSEIVKSMLSVNWSTPVHLWSNQQLAEYALLCSRLGLLSHLWPVKSFDISEERDIFEEANRVVPRLLKVSRFGRRVARVHPWYMNGSCYFYGSPLQISASVSEDTTTFCSGAVSRSTREIVSTAAKCVPHTFRSRGVCSCRSFRRYTAHLTQLDTG